MSVIYRCDGGCHTIIGGCRSSIIEADAYRIAVDIYEPDVPQSDDTATQLRTVFAAGESEFHFCSSACLSSWAMGRALEVPS